MVGGADFAEARRRHQLEEAQARLAVLVALERLVGIRQNLVPGVADGAVRFDGCVHHLAQVRRIPLELLQVAVCFVARKRRRGDERGMTEQIVAHVRLIDDLVLRSGENLVNQRLVGWRCAQLTNRDFLQVNRHDAAAFPMSGGQGKREHDVLLRQLCHQRIRAQVIADEHDVLRHALSQRFKEVFQLGVAHDNENHVIRTIRQKLRHHRDVRHRRKRQQLILDAQPVLLDFLRPFAARQQGHVFSRAAEIACQIAAENTRTENEDFHGCFVLSIIFVPSRTASLFRSCASPLGGNPPVPAWF